ncbi:MAG: hypothetical protein ACFE91_15720 [Promethearchaeota archaeon]
MTQQVKENLGIKEFVEKNQKNLSKRVERELARVKDQDDYRVCDACKSRNPLGDLTCIYCGHIEIML